MKHFGNCTPDEFFAQSMKFREPFVEWVKKIGIPEIRARRPAGFDDKPENKLTPEELAERRDALIQIANENMGEILLAAMQKDLEGTRNVMCLATFTEPEDFNKRTMTEYLKAIMEMLGNTEVKGFFTFFLAPLMKTGTTP